MEEIKANDTEMVLDEFTGEIPLYWYNLARSIVINQLGKFGTVMQRPTSKGYSLIILSIDPKRKDKFTEAIRLYGSCRPFAEKLKERSYPNSSKEFLQGFSEAIKFTFCGNSEINSYELGFAEGKKFAETLRK